ncbi:hypothetical protein ACN4FT_00375 [Aliarcobacter butzleri]|uniref:hypothetical protein n=1 Tax=Aliarcobacter butzleri TaxID=28197 RepID=UPI003AF6B43F
MARKKLKIPISIKTNDKFKEFSKDSHFDFKCSVLAEEHYGFYLIVKNTLKEENSKKHNRLYLDAELEKEFLLTTGFNAKIHLSKNYRVTNFHLFTIHEEYKLFIKELISKIKINNSRSNIKSLLYGINFILNFFNMSKINVPISASEFNIDIHQKSIYDFILNGKITIPRHITNLKNAWKFIKLNFNNSLSELPSSTSPINQINKYVKYEEELENNEITLEVLFQLDYYSQIELDLIMSRFNEYQQWLNELELHGYLFSKENILKTYYKRPQHWLNLCEIYIILYKEDPRCWIPNANELIYKNGKKKYRKIYLNKEEKQRHMELIKISEKGIDISITNEKMFAWWFKTLYPNWPFNQKIEYPYNFVVKSEEEWKYNNCYRLGIKMEEFYERFVPTLNVIYPLYLRLLIDSSANTETVCNIEVYKKTDGTYDMGLSHYNLRMLNSIKNRSNTITPSFINKGTYIDKCINFYLKWLTPIYDYSENNIFLQYIGQKSKIFALQTAKISLLNPLASRHLNNKSRKRRFFEKYEIYQTNEDKNEKNRVWWIQHKNIRASVNIKNYYLEYGEWIRSHIQLGHQSDNVERNHYRKFSWELGFEHQIALTTLHIQKFIEKKIVDKKLENVFTQPHCDCLENNNPTFINAPKIKGNEICTSWRSCLKECEHSKVFPRQHGPMIFAWKLFIEQEYESFLNLEDWKKEYAQDYEIIFAVIEKFNSEDYNFAKSKAAELIPFVRLMMIQTKKKRKIMKGNNDD